MDPVENDFVNKRARRLLYTGLVAVKEYNYDKAIQEFKTSAALVRTPDALTYWGWIEFQLGRPHRALELCHEAIAVDPGFGNPYNDIGSYLVFLGRKEEAVPWFYKALEARRYGPRQFPHINLGELFSEEGNYEKALYHFEEAKSLCPHHKQLPKMIEEVRKKAQDVAKQKDIKRVPLTLHSCTQKI